MFRIGDNVRLKHSGPTMTVKQVHPDYESCDCIWFDRKGHVQEHRFPVEALERIADIQVPSDPKRTAEPSWAGLSK